MENDKQMTELLEQFTSALEALTMLVQTLVQSQTQQAVDIGYLKSVCKNLKVGLARINETLHEGNAHSEPLVLRVSILQHEIKYLGEEVEEWQEKIMNKEEEPPPKDGSAQVKVAIVSAIAAVITSVISVIAQIL